MDEDGAGMSQAEAMIRRVSPEGRLRARREQERRRRATTRTIGFGLVAAIAVLLTALALGAALGPLSPAAWLVAFTLALLAFGLAAVAARPRRPAAARIEGGDLGALPQRTEEWLAAQRPALPAPAVTLLDGIGARLDALAPQLARLDPQTQAADELRKLLGRELPGVVDEYAKVPRTLRAEPLPSGATPDAHLLHSLGTVDRQLAELTRRIASGAVDGLATHDRYLESKYQGDSGLGE